MPIATTSAALANFLKLQDRIGYLFKEPSLLERALTHPSSTALDHCDNERMEFLGDSIVNLCVAQALYDRHPDWSEGDLTQVKSSVVSTAGLARAADSLGLRDVASFGKGLSQCMTLPPSVLANLFEAVAAAVYQDGGLESARSFVLRVLGPEMQAVAEAGGEPNPKSLLQHMSQKNSGITPHYKLVATTGPDHNKIFEISAQVGSRQFPTGIGRNKKEAEQEAARLALEMLEAESISNPTPIPTPISNLSECQ